MIIVRSEIINNIIIYSFGVASKLRKAILIKVSKIKNLNLIRRCGLLIILKNVREICDLMSFIASDIEKIALLVGITSSK